jgi:hypothetical protein
MAGNQNPGYPNVMAARAVSGNTPTDLFMDPTSGAVYAGTWVWNASTLAWEKMTQPVGSTQGDNDAYWDAVRKYYTVDDELEYLCLNLDNDAAEGDTDWLIIKNTWAGGFLTITEKLTGSVTGRAALSWQQT